MEQIIPKSIPNEIKKFNWGALLLNVIWGIRHRVWISLLTFVPVIGISIPILLGFKGNEWAWQKNNYISTTQFLKSQRRWTIAGLAIFITIPLVLYVSIPFVSSYYLIKFFPFETALFVLNSNDKVVDYLGVSIQKVNDANNEKLKVVKTLYGNKVEIDDLKVSGSKRTGIAKLKFTDENFEIITDELIIYDDKYNIMVKN